MASDLFKYHPFSNSLSNQQVDNSSQMDVLNNNVSRIVNFYNDRSVFITGATGFMGKV